ncbi:S66 peptidase family protein [Streptomyces sp. NBC_01477]|uniref:S66 peptidase family protein n=1 Tax=Streptomyces sp. NBC_01477 TaxID=2976015 RepID=UPI002E304133|nr:LD-carboxypeptidase [Streptomyces sp. NBC_01477]
MSGTSTPVHPAAAGLVRPRRLVAGDRVGVVAPAGPVAPDVLDAGLDVLRGWGLEPVVAPHVLDGHPCGYLAGADQARADDLRDAWCDPDLAAVICARGGYGTQRMADLLDWDAMQQAAPKVFLGYSDITVLHQAFATRLGVATLHGPMPGTPGFLTDPAGQEHLRRTLFTPEDVQVLHAPAPRALVPGRAAGVVLGGCLSLLASDLGTRSGRPSAAGGILLLEDVGEEAYRLDRFLTQLLRAGWLDGVAGIALGSWEDCGPYDEVRALLLDRLAPLGVPILEDLGFGHCDAAVTIPLGLPATLDTTTATLTLHTPALH